MTDSPPGFKAPGRPFPVNVEPASRVPMEEHDPFAGKVSPPAEPEVQNEPEVVTEPEPVPPVDERPTPDP